MIINLLYDHSCLVAIQCVLWCARECAQTKINGLSYIPDTSELGKKSSLSKRDEVLGASKG